MMASFRNARYINEESTRIDMELEHHTHGWVPITISKVNYPELWDEVVAKGDIAPFEQPV